MLHAQLHMRVISASRSLSVRVKKRKERELDQVEKSQRDKSQFRQDHEKMVRLGVIFLCRPHSMAMHNLQLQDTNSFFQNVAALMNTSLSGT